MVNTGYYTTKKVRVKMIGVERKNTGQKNWFMTYYNKKLNQHIDSEDEIVVYHTKRKQWIIFLLK